MFTGITEPIEFSFLFVAPMLFVVQVVLAGAAYMIAGMGNMRLPASVPRGPIDTDKAEELIDYVYHQGINYFDTAYFYHEGQSESQGRILQLDVNVKNVCPGKRILPIWTA